MMKYGDRHRHLVEKNGLISKRSHNQSFGETEAESDSENDFFVYNNNNTNSCTSSSETFLAPASPLSPFEQPIEACKRHSVSTLRLNNFVSDSTRQDLKALRKLIFKATSEDVNSNSNSSSNANSNALKLETIAFFDQVEGTQYRRWWYKKENLYHHLEKLSKAAEITLEFHACVEIPADSMSPKSVVDLLKILKADRDVTSIKLSGHLDADSQARCLKSIKNMLKTQDRDWENVQVYTGHNNEGCDCDYQAWRQVMEKYMALFAELYEMHHIPIDLRPTAAAC